MCGEIEEEDRGEAELYARFLAHAHALTRSETGRGETPQQDPIYAFMDRLFVDSLSACTRAAEAADENTRYSILSAQALVFARLAGLLAAHLSLAEDPLRKAVEALLHGYGEADALEPEHGHDHDHGHDHGHDHHHGH